MRKLLLILYLWPSLALAQTRDFGSPVYVFQAFNYKNITTDATFAAIKSGSGVLGRVCINTPATGETITIYDSLTAAGTKIGTITTDATTIGCFQFDANFKIGLTVVTATAASDITLVWQ